MAKACPVLNRNVIRAVEKCIGAKCSWWLEDEKECAVVKIAKNIKKAN